MNSPVLIVLVSVSTFVDVIAAPEPQFRGHRLQEKDCNCGIRNHDDVIVLPRGHFSENHAWPWMASIVNITISDDPEAYCGATIINDRYVLTAAHCIPDMMDTGIHNFRIYLGTNYIQNGTSFLNLGIKKILTHPQFDFDTADNDICLIKLSKPITFTHDVNPVCLGQSKKPYVGDVGYITGWGSLNLTEPTENSLKEARAKVVSNEVCSKNYSSVDIPITEHMICAKINPNGMDGVDPCKGDSGGPLLLKSCNGDSYTQIGIISHGEGCYDSDYPSIFSRVSSYIDWIQENTKDAIYCSDTFTSK